jgi:hypothetical protein
VELGFDIVSVKLLSTTVGQKIWHRGTFPCSL